MKRLVFLIMIMILMIGCDANTTSTVNNTSNPPASESGKLFVHYIDVGQGSATLFHLKDDESEYVILYDVGDWQGDEIVPYLELHNIDSIDLVIVSHPHADHIGQFDKVLQQYDVGEVWMSGNETNTQVFENSMEAILQSETDYAEPRAGEYYDIGPLELAVLHPNKLTGALNEDSISFRLTYGNISFLFTGDTTKREELEMMEHANNIKTNVLLLGHHGSDTSSDPAFIRAVNPEVAIYSAGEDNSYGHPHEEVIDTLIEENIEIYGTDVNGTIILETDGSTYEITTHKDEQNIVTDDHADEDLSEEENTMDSLTENCIDINNASKTELTDIIHIGEARAEQVIDLRPFDVVDELIEVKGIGSETLSDIKEQGNACVGGV